LTKELSGVFSVALLDCAAKSVLHTYGHFVKAFSKTRDM
jgi:hypothetical protein